MPAGRWFAVPRKTPGSIKDLLEAWVKIYPIASVVADQAGALNLPAGLRIGRRYIPVECKNANGYAEGAIAHFRRQVDLNIARFQAILPRINWKECWEFPLEAA